MSLPGLLVLGTASAFGGGAISALLASGFANNLLLFVLTGTMGALLGSIFGWSLFKPRRRSYHGGKIGPQASAPSDRIS